MEVIRLIQSKQILSLRRALMKISIKIPNATGNSHLILDIKELASAVEDEQPDAENNSVTIILTCEPGIYKNICEIIELQTNGKGTVSTLLLKDLVDE